jgi:hypothetical protein
MSKVAAVLVALHVLGATIPLGPARAADPPVLRRPTFAAADRLLTRLDLLLEDGKVTVTTPDGATGFPCTLRARTASVTRVVKVNPAAGPTETEVDVLADITTTTLTLIEGDKTDRQVTTEANALDGRRLRYRAGKAGWDGQLADASTPADLRPALSGYLPPQDETILPDRPVKPGDTWQVKGAALRRFLGSEAIRLDGKAECEFRKVVERDGRPHAVVETSMELEAVALDESQEEYTIRLGLTGQSWLRLDTGREVEFAGKGSMVVERKLAKNQSKLAGRFTLRGTTEVIRPPGE